MSAEAPVTTTPMPPPTPRTQKARGVMALRKWGNYSNTLGGILIQSPEDVEKLPDEGDPEVAPSWEDKFGRPCPPRPEHGFVESRPVTGRAAVAELLKEAQAHFPEAEVLVTPFIQAEYSAVATPTIITVGPGHEGATGGHSAVTFAYQADLSTLNLPLEAAGVKDTPYLEVVYRKAGTTHSPVFVQLRDGPALPLTQDFIPSKVVVKRVEVAEGDLITWGKRVVELAGEEGVVVTHQGGSLASHFGVHCMSRGVPIVTSRAVEVGEVLDVSLPKALNHAQVRRGLLEGFAFEFSNTEEHKSAITLALLACHGLGVNEGGENSRLFGVGVAFLLRISWALGIGEARHTKSPSLCPPELKALLGTSRATAYQKALQTWDASESRRIAVQAANVFRHGSFNGGYGGIKWFACLWCTFKVDTAVRGFLAHPSDEALNHIRRWVNHTINQAHNGGWWYNKLLHHSVLDQASAAKPDVLWPILPFIHRVLSTPQTKVVQPGKWKALPVCLTDVSPMVAALGGVPPAKVEVEEEEPLPTAPSPLLRVQARATEEGQLRLQWDGPGAPSKENTVSFASSKLREAFVAYYNSVPEEEKFLSTAGTQARYVKLALQGTAYGFTWGEVWYTLWVWYPAAPPPKSSTPTPTSDIPPVFLAEVTEGGMEEVEVGEVEAVPLAVGEAWAGGVSAEDDNEDEPEEEEDEEG